MNLWREFLAGYFSGASHQLQDTRNAKVFPSVTLNFQQAAMPEKLEGAVISVILADPGFLQQRQVEGVYQGWQQVSLDFYIRASVKAKRDDGWNQDYLCRRVADLLYATLLDRGACTPLHEKGIIRIRPKAAAIISDKLYSTRHIQCRARYVFDARASFPTTDDLGGD